MSSIPNVGKYLADIPKEKLEKIFGEIPSSNYPCPRYDPDYEINQFIKTRPWGKYTTRNAK